MGIVQEQRTIWLLEDLLKKYLYDGEIPSTTLLQQELNNKTEKFGSLTRSSLNNIPVPQRWDESSASRWNDIIDGVESDLGVILRSLVWINETSLSRLSEWSSRGRALQARIRRLKSRAESLVLLQSDTAGYLAFVEDNFMSLENISSDTTANIDPEAGEVSIGVDRSVPLDPYSGGTRIDTVDSKITVSIIESRNSTFSASPSGSKSEHILSDMRDRWGLEVHSKSPKKRRTSSISGKPIYVEIKIQLPEPTEVSRFLMVTSDATAGGPTVVSAQYSIDGYRWEQVPSASPIQSGTGNFSFRFEKTEMAWVKFLISKSSPDSFLVGETIHDFGIESIKMFSEQYSIADDIVLQTELMEPKAGGESLSFGRAALDVCEEVPEETSIKYKLRAYNSSTNVYSSWIPVIPLQTESNSAVVDFAAPVERNTEDVSEVFNTSLNAEVLNTLRQSDSGSIDYRFFNPGECLMNFYSNISPENISEVTFLRNIGYSSSKFPTLSQDLKVGDVECGWGLENESTYYTYFRVKNPDGIDIDFGDSIARLDSETISGLVHIEPGWHLFKTRRANWFSISSTTVSPTTETLLKSVDPLYPYNHKYLIEGFNYPEGFDGDKVYRGVDIYGRTKLTHIPLSDFRFRGTDLGVFATDILDDGKTIFLVKFDSARPNHSNERCRLFYTSRNPIYNSVQLKASFYSENEEKTPVLTYYRIKVK